jgi:hypothetical protein
MGLAAYARAQLESLIGETIETLTGRPNTLLRVEAETEFVGTRKSPAGQLVPIQWVQDSMDQLADAGELAIEVETVGYRSAFIGAVLLTLPDVVRVEGTR